MCSNRFFRIEIDDLQRNIDEMNAENFRRKSAQKGNNLDDSDNLSDYLLPVDSSHIPADVKQLYEGLNPLIEQAYN